MLSASASSGVAAAGLPGTPTRALPGGGSYVLHPDLTKEVKAGSGARGIHYNG